jgi:hypothetical protein
MSPADMQRAPLRTSVLSPGQSVGREALLSIANASTKINEKTLTERSRVSISKPTTVGTIEPISSPTGQFSEYEEKFKSFNKIRMGYYRLSTERIIVRYAYVPSAILRNNTFSFDDVFGALGISVPNLLFEINSSNDVLDWNMRLPAYKMNLVGSKHPNPPEQYDG